MFDTHMHTCFSADSTMPIAAVQEALSEQKIGVILTEHMDLDFPGDYTFECDIPKYFETYAPYRNNQLLLGIEIGLVPTAIQRNRTIITAYPFDFVLGAIHVANGIDICMDQAYYTAHTKRAVYTSYFESMYEGICAMDCIDSLAHIDYIARYAPYADKEITYALFKAWIDPVLKCLVDKGIALEINTRRLGDDKACQTMRTILEAYKAWGGKYVTCGSDAHNKEQVGHQLAKAYALAHTVGLSPVYFKERQMHYDK